MIRVSCVNYLNSQPFIYGLNNSSIRKEIELSLDVPSVCADKLKNGEVDIGLVPVAVIPELQEHSIVSDYCIGADGPVASVLLLSEVPLDKIETILLDNQSRTSVMLVKVLAEKFWKIHPRWINASDNFEEKIAGNTAAVIIGDRTFRMKDEFEFVYDLAGEWKKYTSLPFVFACWVSNKNIPSKFISDFNDALKNGMQYKKAIADDQSALSIDIEDYLSTKISYLMDTQKQKAMELFFSYVSEIELTQPIAEQTAPDSL